MRIESIKLQGFKSFRNEAVLTFPQNITAVVGPNGVGKSNIADAFRWVLGEQSLRSLRAKDGTDVIFAGSDTQSKLSRALVMVKFGQCGTRDHNLVRQADQVTALPSEIEITRKVYRNGESNYLLNKSEVRLIDIQLFLAQYNVGQKNYAVIGQGMIDAILKAPPQDRIDFFYEATGVKKYQIKLHKARLKLKQSKERLSQIKVLICEITPHKKYLAKQAEKYLKRKAILDELSKKQTLYYKQSFAEIEEAYLNKKQDFQQIAHQQKDIDKEIRDFELQVNNFKKNKDREKRQELNSRFKKLEIEQKRLRNKLDSLAKEKENYLQQKGHFDLAFLHSREREVKDLLNNIKTELSELNNLEKNVKNSYQSIANEQMELQGKIKTLKTKKTEISKERLIQYLQELLNLTELSIIKEKIQSLVNDLNSAGHGNQIYELEQMASELSAEMSELKVKMQVILAKKKMLEQNKDRCKFELDDLRLKLREERVGADVEWNIEWEEQNKKYQQEFQKVAIEIKQVMQKISQIDQAQEERHVKFYQWQKEYNQALDQQRHISELLQANKIEMAKLEFKREQIKQDMSEHLPGLTLKTILENQQIALANNMDLKSLRGEIKKLRKKAASLGEVDNKVLEEYKEIKQRFDFLSEQAEDLESAIKSMDKISQRLQRRIKRQFKEKFDDLNKQFQTYFKILFNGGVGTIKQIYLEDSSQLGIEILAHPPGKKIKHTIALSGGEKSLVTVALICAIISSNPPPFVILDEIDAALDEANSNHLAKIFKTLSKNVQLIIITHNRAIMEIADLLYGVTMDKDGVSKLLGIKLEDYK